MKAHMGGFTLLEILVVVVMIGILTAMIAPSFSLGGRDRELALEADVLARRLELARDEAVARGIELGIEFSPDGYRFVQWDMTRRVFTDVPGDWARFAVREMPEGIDVRAQGEEGEALAALLPAATVDDEADANTSTPVAAAPPTRAPVVFILSSGEVTPFTVEFTAQDHMPVAAGFDFLGNRLANEAPLAGGQYAP